MIEKLSLRCATKDGTTLDVSEVNGAALLTIDSRDSLPNRRERVLMHLDAKAIKQLISTLEKHYNQLTKDMIEVVLTVPEGAEIKVNGEDIEY